VSKSKINFRVIIILMTVLLDSMGIGIMIPVMPELFKSVLPNSTTADVSVWAGALASIFALMQFLFGPLLGTLSDRVGRKPVILISLSVMVGYYLIMAMAQSVWLLLIGRIVGGITAATHATASAYIADISTSEEKAARFGLVGAAFGMGFVLGPVLGGLLGEFGPRAPFYAAAALAALNALSCTIWLHESVTNDIRQSFDWRRANPFGAFQALAKLGGLRDMFIVFLLYSIGTAIYAAIWPFFTEVRFDWSPGMIGISLTIYGVCFAIVQGALVKPFIARFGERRTLIYGLVIEVVSLWLISIMTNGIILLIMIPFAALGVIAQPPLQAWMSRAAGDKNQGALQGVISSLNALAMMMTPITMTSIFYAFSKNGSAFYFPGMPFFISGILVLIALLVFFRIPSQK
jgi:DHA1 family tetracycline resistance protein-like MFS transporter